MKRTARAAALALALTASAALAGCAGEPPAPVSTPVAYAGGWLPEGFPADEIPLVSDEIRYGILSGGDVRPVYEVAVAAPADPESAVGQRLAAAGFAQGYPEWQRYSAGAWNTFTTDDWWITAIVFRVDGDWLAKYSVSRRS